MAEIEKTLYNITGTYTSRNKEPISFKGTLKIDDKNCVEGDLVDKVDKSVIKGKIDGKNLSFMKDYEEKNIKILYTLKQIKSTSEWEGTYFALGSHGVVKCTLTKIVED